MFGIIVRYKLKGYLTATEFEATQGTMAIKPLEIQDSRLLFQVTEECEPSLLVDNTLIC
jgi:hypothetical protein